MDLQGNVDLSMEEINEFKDDIKQLHE